MKKHKGHHGGAWKVAYADFVTAMMALFLVLWLTAQDSKIKEAIERAFRHPYASLTKESVGIIPSDIDAKKNSDGGNFDSASAVELALLRRLNEDLIQTLQSETEDPNLRSVEIELTPDGLRISIFDRSQRPIFEPQSVSFTTYGQWVFTTLAWEVARHRTFSVELEGHTESGHPPPRDDYGNWELSTDRANATRRILIGHGVHDSQVRKVAGFADTYPMPNRAPNDESNRRVTVMLRVADGIS